MSAGLRIGSLFSGIGGLELGLEWAGVGSTVWQCESDPFCRQVLARHWPGVPCFEDVKTMGAVGDDVPDVEVKAQSGVGRVADGVPGRVDRLRALGNAVVPQCAEVVGRRLLEVHRWLV